MSPWLRFWGVEPIDIAGTADEQDKMSIIKQIVGTVVATHLRGCIHRDRSPTSIFLLGSQLKIADYGLGKNLNTLSSYQTTDTNNYGQLFHCPPE